MFEELFDNFPVEEFTDSITKLLEFEECINIKKIIGEELSPEEYIFDNFLISPSIIVRHLTDRFENNGSNN